MIRRNKHSVLSVRGIESGGRLSGRGVCSDNGHSSIAVGVGLIESCWWHRGRFQDFKTRYHVSNTSANIIVTDSNKYVAIVWVLYCVKACKIKHFTKREFSGIFFFGGGGDLRFQNGNFWWLCRASTKITLTTFVNISAVRANFCIKFYTNVKQWHIQLFKQDNSRSHFSAFRALSSPVIWWICKEPFCLW